MDLTNPITPPTEEEMHVMALLHDAATMAERIHALKGKMSNQELVKAATDIIGVAGFIGGILVERMDRQ